MTQLVSQTAASSEERPH